MRRFSLGVTLIALPAFAFTLMLAGCGGGGGNKDTASSGSGGNEGGGDKSSKKELTVLEPGKGVLKGKITLNGKPDLKAMTEKLHEEMKKKDTDYCMKGSETETTEQAFRIGDKGTLGNVFVWVVPDSGTFFKVTEDQIKALPKTVDTHQPHCAFIPHCLFHFPVYHPNEKKPKDTKTTGQVWVVHNDAEVGHNTKFEGGAKNKGENITLASKAPPRKFDSLVPESKEVTISCNIHPWMNAYMRVVDTPYYAISLSDTLSKETKVGKEDPKFGTFEIKNLPEGHKVRVIAWHEKCGYLNKDGGKGEVIEILPGKETAKDFEAKAP